MGYKPRPWPPVANRHRTRAILDAGAIKKMASAAADEVFANPDLVIAKLRHIATLAQVIVDTLESAPGPEPQDGREEDS